MFITSPITPTSSKLIEQNLLIPARVIALDAPARIAHALVTRSLAQRALGGQDLGMLIGDNRFDAYAIARAAQNQHLDPARVLAHIEVSRAFTCHQLQRRIVTLDDPHLTRWRALYVTGLLDTFYDESVDYSEAARLLLESLTHLKELAAKGLPVLMTLAPSKKDTRPGLAKLVAQNVDAYWHVESSPPPPATPAQFQMTFAL